MTASWPVMSRKLPIVGSLDPSEPFCVSADQGCELPDIGRSLLSAHLGHGPRRMQDVLRAQRGRRHERSLLAHEPRQGLVRINALSQDTDLEGDPFASYEQEILADVRPMGDVEHRLTRADRARSSADESDGR